jgi:hypothetical protein
MYNPADFRESSSASSSTIGASHVHHRNFLSHRMSRNNLPHHDKTWPDLASEPTRAQRGAPSTLLPHQVSYPLSHVQETSRTDQCPSIENHILVPPARGPPHDPQTRFHIFLNLCPTWLDLARGLKGVQSRMSSILKRSQVRSRT